MATRRPLVQIAGDIQELPLGDQLDVSIIPPVSASPAGLSGQVQYNNNGSLGGAANLLISSEGDPLIQVVDGRLAPAIPPVDRLVLFGRRFGPSGGRVMVAAMGPSGMDYVLQPSIWRQKISRWNAAGGSTTVPGVDGMPAISTGGMAISRGVATTNALTRAKRIGYVSSTTAGNYAGVYQAVAQYTLGNGLVGGFFMSCRFGVSDTILRSAARTFVGMSSSTVAPTNVDPATLTNSIGIGHTASDTNWYFYYGGTTAQKRMDLGSNFPINNTDLLDFSLWSPPDANGVIYFCLERIALNALYITYGTINSNGSAVYLPSNTTLLAFRAWRNNNTAAAAVGIDISSIYLETDW